MNLGFDFKIDKIPPGRFSSVVNFYKKSKIRKRIPGFDVNGVFIPFNPSHKKIGIMFSAGTDSTILFYILCQLIEQEKLDIKVFPITVIKQWAKNKRWLFDSKMKVYEFIKNKFPNIVGEIQLGYLPLSIERTPIQNLALSFSERTIFRPYVGTGRADLYYFREYKTFVAEYLNLQAIYDGTTTNPVGVKLPETPEFRNIEHTNLKEIDQIISFNEKSNYDIITPFNFIEKNWTVAQFENFDLEELKKMTRSCLEKDVGDEGCGGKSCFPCSERIWANNNKNIFLKDFHEQEEK